MLNRHLWVCVVWFTLTTSPALAYQTCSFAEVLLTWLFGLSYLALWPLLVLSLGMGWRTFITTIATAVLVVCGDRFRTFIVNRNVSSSGDCHPSSGFYGTPMGWDGGMAFVVLGGFFAVLLRFALPVLWKPANPHFLLRPGAGWLHRIHAAFLVCVACLVMWAVVLLVVSERRYFVDQGAGAVGAIY